MRAVAAGLTIASLTLAAAAPAPDGVWTSVCLVGDAGDLVGMEVEFRAGANPSVVVTDCEGECSGGKAWPVTLTDGGLSFTVRRDDLVDQDGRPAPGEAIRYVGRFRFKDSMLVLTSPDQPGLKEILRRVRAPRPGQTAELGCGKAVC